MNQYNTHTLYAYTPANKVCMTVERFFFIYTNILHSLGKVEPLRFYPPYTNGFFFSLLINWNGFWQFFFFFQSFGLKQLDFREKKCFFA